LAIRACARSDQQHTFLALSVHTTETVPLATAREAVEAHNGEALPERMAFDALSADEQNSIVEFLKSLQVFERPQGIGARGRRKKGDFALAQYPTGSGASTHKKAPASANHRSETEFMR
jgi:hypothetical protein